MRCSQQSIPVMGSEFIVSLRISARGVVACSVAVVWLRHLIVTVVKISQHVAFNPYE